MSRAGAVGRVVAGSGVAVAAAAGGLILDRRRRSGGDRTEEPFGSVRGEVHTIKADDGLLHVFVLPMGGIVGGTRGVLELLLAESQGVFPSGAAARLSGRHIRIEVMPPALTQVDGDPFPAAGLEATITPGGLLVIRP